MKRILFTICLSTIAGAAAYAQSTAEATTATASINVNMTLPNPPSNNNNSNNAMIGGNNNSTASNSNNVQVSSISNNYLVFSSRANELNAVLARGSAPTAQNIYNDLDQMIRNIMDENQSELESENNPQLATTLAQQKMLYSEIKKLSSNLVANQDALKVKLDQFLATL